MKKAWASRSKKGFTIVELLVVIVIIGILATLTIIAYSGIQTGTRDSQRTKDVTQLKIAIEKYHADNSQYPGVCSADNVSCPATNLAASLQPYLSSIPTDPSTIAGSALDYQYIRGPLASDNYGILINYEKATDCVSGQRVSASWTWSGLSYPTCTNF